MSGYPEYPPLPGGAVPPFGEGPRPEPWDTPGNRVPAPLTPPVQYVTVRRTPAWVWVVVIALVLLLVASVLWAVDLRSQRDQLREAKSHSTAPGGPGTAAPGSNPAATDRLAATVSELEKTTERVRQHTFKSELKVDVVTPEELADRFTRANARDVNKPKQTSEGRRLGLLGVVPPSVASRFPDYLNDLYREGVAGYYDPTTKELVVGAPAGDLKAIDKITIVHELTHALTDQYFDFGSKTDALDRQSGRDEELGAFVALIEGDATLTMNVYATQFLDPKDLAGGFGEIPSTPLFDSAPRFIRDTVLFPYTEGLSFVQSSYNQGSWKAVDDLYLAPPTTTEQILHPEKYAAKEGAKAVEVPDLDLGTGWRKMESSSLGEFQLREILAEAMPGAEATRGAAGWGGDRFLQYETAASVLLAVRIVADNPGAAASMNTAMRRYLDRWDKSSQGGSSLTLRGDTITLVLSSDAAAAATATQRLNG